MLRRRVNTDVGLVDGERLAQLLQHLALVAVNLLYRDDLPRVARLPRPVYRELHGRRAADEVAQAGSELVEGLCWWCGGRSGKRLRCCRRGGLGCDGGGEP